MDAKKIMIIVVFATVFLLGLAGEAYGPDPQGETRVAVVAGNVGAEVSQQ
jgi:hypothetical protein